jgi:DNA polymerase-3 subunit delta
LRMPSAKPDKGAQLLAELAAEPPPDVVCLVVTGKLDKKTGDAPWVRAIEKHGVWVPVWPVETAALPGWLRARAKAMHLDMEPAAARLIVERVEGNLLAAKQELEKLCLLANGEPISSDLVLRSVGDSARYDVFQLAQAAAAGDAARALRVLVGLRSEGVEPTLILWALVRELRGLWQARERDRLRSTVRGSGWNLAAAPSPRALSRLKELPLAQLLVEASHTDRIIKGLAPGDAWSALTGLTGGLAGALQATANSGRVGI